MIMDDVGLVIEVRSMEVRTIFPGDRPTVTLTGELIQRIDKTQAARWPDQAQAPSSAEVIE